MFLNKAAFYLFLGKAVLVFCMMFSPCLADAQKAARQSGPDTQSIQHSERLTIRTLRAYDQLPQRFMQLIFELRSQDSDILNADRERIQELLTKARSGVEPLHILEKDLNELAVYMQGVEPLIEVLGLENHYADAIVQALRDLISINPSWEAHTDILVDYIEERIGWDAIRPEVARLYNDSFSDLERWEIIRFYQTSVGQKWLVAGTAMEHQILELVRDRFDADIELLELRIKNREFENLLEQMVFAPPEDAFRRYEE